MRYVFASVAYFRRHFYETPRYDFQAIYVFFRFIKALPVTFVRFNYTSMPFIESSIRVS